MFLKIVTMKNNVDSITSNRKNHVNCEKWDLYGIFFGCGESLFTYK